MNELMLAYLNGWEIVLALAIVLILFGAKRLPELARGLGQGIREFKKSSREIQDEIEAAAEPEYRAPQRKIPADTQARPDTSIESSESKA